MKIPVILALPSQEPLQESAANLQHGTPKGILKETRIPKNVELDRSFSAIPIGRGDFFHESLDTLSPERSEQFAVRGTVDVDSIDEIPQEHDGARVFADPMIDAFPTCGSTPAVGDHQDVANHLQLTTLHDNDLDGDGVAIAIMDTGINLAHLKSQLGSSPRVDISNSWTPAEVTTSPFQFPTGHGTMCAYDTLIAAPKATLLDFPILRGNAPGGSAMGQSLSVALVAFSQLLAFWAVAFSPSGSKRFKALVVNNSWGMYHQSGDFPAGHLGRYADNPNHPFNVIVATLARSNADIIFAAGNCGSDCPDRRCLGSVTDTIMGANALGDVLTFAGCDIHDQRVGYSSQGPSITGMHHEKPDLTAYTHFEGSEAFGHGVPDTGTSTACPVGAGCVAALRTSASLTAFPSSNLFDQLRATARSVPSPGWNGDFGYGIIDPVSAGQSMGLI